MFNKISIFLIGFLISGGLLAQKKLPLHEGVKTGKMWNGMRYYIINNGKPEQRAELRLVVRAGSNMENENQQGLAHFLEHMAFNGTKNFEKQALIDFLETTGVKFGPDLNAYTSFEETVYMLQARTDSMRYYNRALQILRDWSGDITLEVSEIEKERGVVMSEYRSRLSGNQRAQQVTFPVMYQNSRYAERLPIGKPDIIQTAQKSVFEEFYTDWYRPKLMSIIVVGDVDEKETRKLIRKKFRKLKNKRKAPKSPEFILPLDSSIKAVAATDPEITTKMLNIKYRLPEVGTQTEVDYAKQLEFKLINQILATRSADILRKPNQPVANVYYSLSNDLGKTSVLNIYAVTKEMSTIEGLHLAVSIARSAAFLGFNDAEVSDAKRNIKKQLEAALKEKDNTNSERIARQLVSHVLGKSVFLSPEKELELFNTYETSINNRILTETLKSYLSSPHKYISYTGPEDDEMGTLVDEVLAQELSNTEQMEPTPYIYELNRDFLTRGVEGFEDDNIQMSSTFNDLGYKQVSFGNGLRMMYRKTDFEKDQITFEMFANGGNSALDSLSFLSANYATSVLQESGLSDLNPTDIKRILSGKKVGVTPYLANSYHGLYGGCSPDDMEYMFQLMRLYISEPRFDQTAFENVRDREITYLQNVFNNPDVFLNANINMKLYDNNYRTTLFTPKQLYAMDLREMQKAYTERFSTINQFTLVITGNFDEAKLLEYTKNYLASLTSQPTKGVAYVDNDFRIKGQEEVIQYAMGKAQKTQVRLIFSGPFQSNQTEKLKLQATCDLVRLKLRENLREEMGGVYGVGVQNSINSPHNDQYTIIISFNCEPDRVDELTNAAHETIEQLKSRINGQDILKIQEQHAQEIKKFEKTSRYWQSSMVNVEKFGFDSRIFNPSTQLETYRSFNEDEYRNLVTRFFDRYQLKTFILNPENRR